ncbi:hypothetical protein RRF57_004338 [Xylaria bambusicola]|uniref:Ubiquitin 3 binding protein But2 C-terminal domain-containing protein n=1 Tax=Xylaria bambusicola TaxID=326684 RepID=A0AAN7UJ23_9PEZI
MRLFIIPLFIGILVNASATIRPRQFGNSCCFDLHSVGIVGEEVEENYVGELSLGGPFQQGGFCFDKSTRTVKDTLNHNCFMRAPDEKFQCYPGIPLTSRPLVWTANHTSPTMMGRYLSDSKPDKTGCVSVALALYGSSAGCSTSTNNTVVAPTSRPKQIKFRGSPSQLRQRQIPAATPTTSTVSGYSQVPGAGLWSSMPSSANPSTSTKATVKASSASVKSSQTCSILPSAPSIAPIRLGSHDKSAPDGIKDSLAEASITSQNSTVFLYNIPSSFLPSISEAKPSLCALQFRMPVCTELPKGYPCYNFSGLEQEVLANSGMNFDLILDDGQAEWNGTVLQQVFPGENTILGTFECGAPKGSYNDRSRKMGWNASSVRGFGLEFLHAGVGDNAKYQDGIGAWIVPCQ